MALNTGTNSITALHHFMQYVARERVTVLYVHPGHSGVEFATVVSEIYPVYSSLSSAYK